MEGERLVLEPSAVCPGDGRCAFAAKDAVHLATARRPPARRTFHRRTGFRGSPPN